MFENMWGGGNLCVGNVKYFRWKLWKTHSPLRKTVNSYWQVSYF